MEWLRTPTVNKFFLEVFVNREDNLQKVEALIFCHLQFRGYVFRREYKHDSEIPGERVASDKIRTA